MSAAKLLFAGTPNFARESLRTLVSAGYVPDAVLTQPDRPAGRGKKLTASPVKEFALEQNIPVQQPKTLKDPQAVAAIAALQPDLMIVAAYGLLLPQDVLDIPRHGCLNVHASLLPRWRGAAPIQAALLAADEETGISLMQMEAGLDSGPVFQSAAIKIGTTESAGDLHDRLAVLGGEMLVNNLERILNGTLLAEPQDESKVTYAGKIRTQDAAIDWRDSAECNLRKIRAFNPVPGAFFLVDDERIKCWQAELADSEDGVVGAPGTILAAGTQGIDVACDEGILRLLVVQRPGKRRITAAEFANQKSLPGMQLSSNNAESD